MISTRRYFEVVASAVDAQGVLRLGIVTWDTAMTGQPSSLKFAVDDQPLQVSVFNTFAVPKEVRKELQDFRFVNPPMNVGWLELTTETVWQQRETAPGVAEVTVQAVGDERRLWGDSCRVVVRPPVSPGG
ncbi:MAG: hypothetical protein HC898_08625 [Phycisphaerales bacterium]|nr:hypothetical protein [Phycisphaerales bacterium]